MKVTNVSKAIKCFLMLLLISAPMYLYSAGIQLISPNELDKCVVEGEIKFSWSYDNPTDLPITDVFIHIYKDGITLVFTDVLDNDAVSYLLKSKDVPEMEIKNAFTWEISARIGGGQVTSPEHRFYLIPKANFGNHSLENDAQCVETNITLDWASQVPEYDYFYEVQVSKSINFDVLVDVVLNLDRTSAEVELENNTQYYWRLKNIECPNNISEVRTFSTIYLPVTLISPENSTQCDVVNENDKVTTNLVWAADASYTGHYLLEITDYFTEEVIVNVQLQDNIYKFDVTGLLDRIFSWKVQLVDSDGEDFCNISWSESFVFNTPLENPEILSPIDEICMPMSVEFKWESNNSLITGMNYIEILISKTSNFADTVHYISAPNPDGDGKCIIVMPEYSQRYYYKIRERALRPIDDDDENDFLAFSLWSEVENFETSTEGPKLVSPPNDTFGIEHIIKLVWTKVPNTEAYIIETCLDSNFTNSSAHFQIFHSPDTFFMCPAQLGISEYIYWRVMAEGTDGECNSDYSEIRRFSSSLAIPEIISPTDLSAEPTNDIIFMWKEVSNADKYDLEYSKNKIAFDTLYGQVTEKTNIIDTTTTVYSLDTNTTYYWRIKARNNAGATSGWSPIYEFKTGYEQPYYVTLLFPNDNTTNASRFETYRWRSVQNAKQYQIEFSTEADFSENNIEFITENNDTTFTLSASMFDEDFPPFLYETKYYWRVRAINSTTLGAWSKIWSFVTLWEMIDGSWTLQLPANNNDNVYADSVHFRWQGPSWAKAFKLLILTTNQDIVLEELIPKSGNPTNFIYRELEKSTTYNWKVFASEDAESDEYGVWSEIWTFTTKDILGILDDTFIHSISVVPNPASNNATLNMNIKEAGLTTMIITDMNGNVVLSTEKYLNFGDNFVNIDATSLASGNYIILLYNKKKLVGTISLIIAK